jgi:hypothetical protein
VSPGLTRTSAGEKPVEVIETVTVVARDELLAVAADAVITTAIIAMRRNNVFLIATLTP